MPFWNGNGTFSANSQSLIEQVRMDLATLHRGGSHAVYQEHVFTSSIIFVSSLCIRSITRDMVPAQPTRPDRRRARPAASVDADSSRSRGAHLSLLIVTLFLAVTPAAAAAPGSTLPQRRLRGGIRASDSNVFQPQSDHGDGDALGISGGGLTCGGMLGRCSTMVCPKPHGKAACMQACMQTC